MRCSNTHYQSIVKNDSPSSRNTGYISYKRTVTKVVIASKDHCREVVLSYVSTQRQAAVSSTIHLLALTEITNHVQSAGGSEL